MIPRHISEGLQNYTIGTYGTAGPPDGSAIWSKEPELQQQRLTALGNHLRIPILESGHPMFKEVVNHFYRHMDFKRCKNGTVDEHLDNTARNRLNIVRSQVAYATIIRSLGTFLSAAAACGHPLPVLPKQPRWRGGSTGNWVSGFDDEICTLDKPNYDIPFLFDLKSNQGYSDFPGVTPEGALKPAASQTLPSEIAVPWNPFQGAMPPSTEEKPSVEDLSRGSNFPRPLLPGDIFNVPMMAKGKNLFNLDIYTIYRKSDERDPPGQLQGVRAPS